jgi:hypothetical protein
MKLPVLLVMGLCLAACTPAKSTADTSASSEATLAPQAVMLPEGFIGRWDASLEACKATSDMKLTITQTELTFWESAGHISAVTVKSSDDIIIKADFSGEGEQWQRDLHLELSENGQILTLDGDKGSIRHRCE